jgi:hypothetical protein
MEILYFLAKGQFNLLSTLAQHLEKLAVISAQKNNNDNNKVISECHLLKTK